MRTVLLPARRRSPRRAAAGVCLLAGLLLVATGGHVPHSHASRGPALFNEQHALENPGALGGDVTLTPADGACLIAVIAPVPVAAGGTAPAPAPARQRQSRAPPSA